MQFVSDVDRKLTAENIVATCVKVKMYLNKTRSCCGGCGKSEEKVLIGIKINDTNFQMQIELKRNLTIKMQR